jgi:predicted nucleotidyltransferase
MDKEVKDIVDRIVSNFSPEKIILFGSRARGDNHKDSDVDLLVLKSGIKKRREATLQIGKSLRGICIATDIIVETPSHFQELIHNPSMVYSTIKKEGKVVYEKKSINQLVNKMEKEVKYIIDKIVENFSPEKIILFGSRARRDNRKDSDIDLLFLFKKIKNKNELERAMQKAIYPRFLPLDLIINTEEKYEEIKSNKYLVYHHIDKEGVILYE